MDTQTIIIDEEILKQAVADWHNPFVSPKQYRERWSGDFAVYTEEARLRGLLDHEPVQS